VVGGGDRDGTRYILSGGIRNTHNPGSHRHDSLHIDDSCDNANSCDVAASRHNPDSLDDATCAADDDADHISAPTSNHDAHDLTDYHDHRSEYGRRLLLTAVGPRRAEGLCDDTVTGVVARPALPGVRQGVVSSSGTRGRTAAGVRGRSRRRPETGLRRLRSLLEGPESYSPRSVGSARVEAFENGVQHAEKALQLSFV